LDNYHYDEAQTKLRDALRYPSFDDRTRHQIILRAIEVSVHQGNPIIPELLTELRDLLDSDISAKARAETLYVIGQAEMRMGRYNEAADIVKESLSLYRSLIDPERTVSALNSLAHVHINLGDWNELKKVTNEALKLARESGDTKGYGSALMNCAFYERNQGFHDLAKSHYELASQMLEKAGDRRFLATALNNLADLEITGGSLSKGLHLLQQALFQWRTIGNPGKISIILTQMGRVSILKGHLLEAEEFLSASVDLASCDPTLKPQVLVFALYSMADFERKRGNLDSALQLAKKATSLLENSEISGHDLAWAWGMITSILLEMKDIDQAEDALATSDVICSSLEFLEGIISNILLRGILELQKGNLGLAQEYLEKARKKSKENKLLEVQIQTELSLADLYLRKLQIDYEVCMQENAAACLIRASQIAEATTLQPGKLEAKILEAVALSISMMFEDAVKILRDVEATAHSLELYLIEEKARRIRIPIVSRMRALSIPTELDEELLDYIAKAQEYVVEAQSAFKDPLKTPFIKQ
jgi:tetratricopeptide (TPR) repeat protein